MDAMKLIEENALLKRLYDSSTSQTSRDVLLRQTLKGYGKYGDTVKPETLTASEWLAHLHEEVTDAKVYASALAMKDLNQYEMQKIVMIYDILLHIEQLILRLQGLRNGVQHGR